jgi:hypothetical protein
MKQDSHNQAIPEAVVSAAETAIDAQLQALTAYATPLTPPKTVATCSKRVPKPSSSLDLHTPSRNRTRNWLQSPLTWRRSPLTTRTLRVLRGF